MASLTAEELLKHPEYNHTVWVLKPEKQDKVAVAKDRGGPINISYEVHGHGDRHIVWIMGLGAMKYAWQRQTKDFAHTKGDTYSSLIFDNRGVGDSDKPRFRYSTSEMAKDIVEIVDHLGWTGKRELHVIGISMGGMIAQELGFLENLWNRANLFIPKAVDVQIENVKKNLYTSTWLSAPDTAEPITEPFPTNGDRFAANELWKRQQPESFQKAGFLLQAVAAGWHYKSPEQLQQIAKTVGKRRIMVVHGTQDRMITFPHGVVLWRGLEKGEAKTGKENWLGIEEEEDVWEEGEVEKRFVKGQGHVVPAEMRDEFQEWVEGLIERGIKLNGEEGV
ncbi:alpha/beta-hydrolase [Dothidotthia symphoricarpi CBS 119687]|uniref:Alpha/beta-hydrolase n=1 Tax=Dothidotthia symphoricarpi CBS 119687 TaxID=1392245 RepID=A0A6A6A4J4_9PLEO|nr:alpha/beta-hydrolase [Dothidotthia symphoricarpi CBS 119687]KAF2125678.1 alpha/beta-hydrolase [Dothidotthia symphoricarpi CBS 119687]